MSIDVLLIHIPLLQNFIFPIKDISPFVIRNLLSELKSEYSGVELGESNLPITDYGILSIASYLKNEGMSVQYFYPIIDDSNPVRGFSEYLNELRNAIKKYDPLVIGAGSYTYQYPLVLAIFRFVKILNPNIVTIIGGHHSSFMDVQTLRDSKSVDIVVRGEGEETLFRVVKSLHTNGHLQDVLGITYREKNDQIKRNDVPPKLDPDRIPVPTYDLIPDWLWKSRVVSNISTGRGCPHSCLFCTERKIWGKPRIRPVERIIEEIKLIYHDYNNLNINFNDDSFAWNSKFFYEILEAVKEEGMFFRKAHFLMRVDEINQNNLKELKKIAEKIEISLGLESASPKVLKVMRKNITFNQSICALKKIAKTDDIIPKAFWIIGHPGSDPEAEETSFRGQEFLMKNRLCMLHEVSTFIPYPGLEPFAEPNKYGVKILTYNWSKYCENPPTFPPVSCLGNLDPLDIYHYYNKRQTLSVKGLSEHLGYEWKDVSLKI